MAPHKIRKPNFLVFFRMTYNLPRQLRKRGAGIRVCADIGSRKREILFILFSHSLHEGKLCKSRLPTPTSCCFPQRCGISSPSGNETFPLKLPFITLISSTAIEPSSSILWGGESRSTRTCIFFVYLGLQLLLTLHRVINRRTVKCSQQTGSK